MDGWNAESDAATLLNGLGVSTDDHYTLLADCRALIQQVIEITGNDCSVTWKASDFKTEVLEDEK